MQTALKWITHQLHTTRLALFRKYLVQTALKRSYTSHTISTQRDAHSRTSTTVPWFSHSQHRCTHLIVLELAIQRQVSKQARGDVPGVVEHQAHVNVAGAVDDGLRYHKYSGLQMARIEIVPVTLYPNQNQPNKIKGLFPRRQQIIIYEMVYFCP